MSQQAEQAVLGRILAKPKTLVDVIDILKPEHFYSQAHGLIYQACLNLFRDGSNPDVVAVSDELDKQGVLMSAGGRTYIGELAGSDPIIAPEQHRYHAGLVFDSYLKNTISIIGAKLQHEVNGLSGKELLELAQQKLFQLAQEGVNTSEKSAQDLKEEAIQIELSKQDGKHPGHPSGLKKLDAMTLGLSPSELITIAGRPGMGKSSLAGNMAFTVARHSPVIFYSYEMAPVDIMNRMLKGAAESPFPSKMRDVLIPDHLHILEATRMSAHHVRASLMRYKMLYSKIGLVVVDYLQLMPGEGDNMAQKVGNNARMMKDLAMEFKTPVVLLSQLSRAVEARQDKRPMMSDLKESGGIEEASDEIILIYRDEKYNINTTDQGVAELDLAKNRDGETGYMKVLFRGDIQKFIDPVSYF